MNELALARLRLAEEVLLAAADADSQLRGQLRYMRAVVQVRLLIRDSDRNRMIHPGKEKPEIQKAA